MSLAGQIRHTSLGEELDERQAAVLEGIASVLDLSENEYLIEEGSRDDSLHLLLAGKLEVVKKTAMGEESALHILREGDMTGELSFVDGMTHSIGVRALVGCRVLSLRRKEFESLITREPELVYRVMRAIIRSVHTVLHRMNQQHVELSNYIYKQHGRY